MKKQTIIITLITLTYITYNILLATIANNQLNQQAEAYRQCIIKQSQEQQYIIRSECSTNYKQLDKITKLKYKQIKLDLYLEQ